MADLYSCPLGCVVRTETPTELAEHCLQNKPLHSREYNCRCLICKEAFKSSRLWAEHWIDKHCYHCGHCNSSQSSYYALAVHCEKEHKGILYACSCKFCPAQFKTSSDWGTHFTQQHAFLCPLCQRDLGNVNSLNQHFLDHEVSGKLPLECYLCKKMLGNLSDWSEHYSAHWGVDTKAKEKQQQQLLQQQKMAQSNIVDNNPKNSDLNSRIEAEKLDRKYQLLCDENLQLRQLIHSLTKNSITLMQKINNNDRSIRSFSDHMNCININRAGLMELKQLSQEQEKLSVSLLGFEDTLTMCVICFDKKRQWACHPCGHFVYCNDCKPPLNAASPPGCAVCRAKVSRFDNVYLV